MLYHSLLIVSYLYNRHSFVVWYQKNDDKNTLFSIISNQYFNMFVPYHLSF